MIICILEHYDGELSGVFICDTSKLDMHIPECKKFKKLIEDPKVFYNSEDVVSGSLIEGKTLETQYDISFQNKFIRNAAIYPPCHIDKVVEIFVE